jgi:hypothetical protein
MAFAQKEAMSRGCGSRRNKLVLAGVCEGDGRRDSPVRWGIVVSFGLCGLTAELNAQR